MDVLKSFLITMSSLRPIVSFGCIVLVSKFYCYKDWQFHNSYIEMVWQKYWNGTTEIDEVWGFLICPKMECC